MQSHREVSAYFRSKLVTMGMQRIVIENSLSNHMKSPFKARRDATCAKVGKCQRVSDEILSARHDMKGPCRDAKTKSSANKNQILAHFGHLLPIAPKQAIDIFW
jgi:hypothetical protein